jgi:glutamate racemase
MQNFLQYLLNIHKKATLYGKMALRPRITAARISYIVIMDIEYSRRAIGFFDSGLGGLSVLKSAAALLPRENYIYYADNKNAPYGNMDDNKITALTENGARTLLKSGVKMLVLACNTATAAAAAHLRRILNIPVIGLEPAVLPAAKSTKSKKILVLATKATIDCKNYPRDFNGARAEYCACQNLAGLIENNYHDDGKIFSAIQSILLPYNNWDYDCLVLGCTHYVLKKSLFEKALRGKAEIFDGNCGTARNMARILLSRGLISDCGGNVTILLSKYSKKIYNLYNDIINS